MFLVQLPTMPMLKQSVKTEGSEMANSSKPSKARACSLNELPGGFMGKMLVYKSGAVKLKLGETLFNVSLLHYSITRTYFITNFLKITPLVKMTFLAYVSLAKC